jgi:hypothetical protein
MSVEALSLVLHHSRAKGTAKLVAIGIANHAGDGGAWPTLATLARYANVSPRNVRQGIARLVALGEIRVDVQNGGTHDQPDHRRPNRYTILLACPAWCDHTSQHRDTRRRLAVVETPLEGGSESTPVRGMKATPAIPHRGSESTGEGGTIATPKPSLEPNPQDLVPQVQDTREGSCSECGAASAYACQRVQVKWALEERHPYTPATRAGTNAATKGG